MITALMPREFQFQLINLKVINGTALYLCTNAIMSSLLAVRRAAKQLLFLLKVFCFCFCFLFSMVRMFFPVDKTLGGQGR